MTSIWYARKSQWQQKSLPLSAPSCGSSWVCSRGKDTKLTHRMWRRSCKSAGNASIEHGSNRTDLWTLTYGVFVPRCDVSLSCSKLSLRSLFFQRKDVRWSCNVSFNLNCFLCFAHRFHANGRGELNCATSLLLKAYPFPWFLYRKCEIPAFQLSFWTVRRRPQCQMEY